LDFKIEEFFFNSIPLIKDKFDFIRKIENLKITKYDDVNNGNYIIDHLISLIKKY